MKSLESLCFDNKAVQKVAKVVKKVHLFRRQETSSHIKHLIVLIISAKNILVRYLKKRFPTRTSSYCDDVSGGVSLVWRGKQRTATENAMEKDLWSKRFDKRGPIALRSCYAVLLPPCALIYCGNAIRKEKKVWTPAVSSNQTFIFCRTNWAVWIVLDFKVKKCTKSIPKCEVYYFLTETAHHWHNTSP